MAKRVVLVTGASSGIGKAIVERLLSSNHRVVAVARDFSGSALEADALAKHELDLADLEALPARLTELARLHSDVDALVCNAGQGRFGSLEEFSYNQIKALVDLDLTSQLFVVRAFLPLLKRRPSADVVLMGSEAALAGGRRGVVYTAAKSGLRGFARALREEGARSGLRVSLVNPGAVRTEFYRDAPFGPGPAKENALEAGEVADTVCSILESRPGIVFDEVNLSPLKKVLDFGENRK